MTSHHKNEWDPTEKKRKYTFLGRLIHKTVCFFSLSIFYRIKGLKLLSIVIYNDIHIELDLSICGIVKIIRGFKCCGKVSLHCNINFLKYAIFN